MRIDDNCTGVLIIGYDSENGKDISVLNVGIKNKGEAVKVINTFEGEEADELYRKLTGVKSETDNDENMIASFLGSLCCTMSSSLTSITTKFGVGDLIMVNGGKYKNRVGRIVEACLDGAYRVDFGNGDCRWCCDRYLSALDLANDGLYLKEG